MSQLSDNMRAGVLLYLEFLCDEQGQRAYQAAAPHINVSHELFNKWGDFYHRASASFRLGFSEDELDALAQFDAVENDVCAATPKWMPPLEEFVQTAAWRQLTGAARVALERLASDRSAL